VANRRLGGAVTAGGVVRSPELATSGGTR
jgi:hypothetical protein